MKRTAAEMSAECHRGMCRLCTGPKVIKRDGAPVWEAPIMTLRCDCRCHRHR
ncbi:hypothetical protein GA0115233_103023 [Streptomyces sp. DI166]|uniref:hypothetical protein n=1 Tax=unclassified Streptomyces TaxID=2593676 RepID=UPI0007F3CE0B|nr:MULTISPECIES: hypothetical protein [unclassified Streptomyces]SBT91391.1 hypothetical protein GA0115233_103023 [Streptomyces sp. DI166]